MADAKRASWPVHLLLIALFPVVSLLGQNVDRLHGTEPLLPMVCAFVLAALAWGVACVIVRDGRRGALFASWTMFLFFAFGHGATMAQRVVSYERAAAAVGLGFGLLWIGGLWVLHLAKAHTNMLTTLLNRIAWILVLIPAATAAFRVVGGGSGLTSTLEPIRFSASLDHKPDIYFIVLDAYGRGDVLRELFDYDNREFLDGLRRRGFFVDELARSNYVQTFLSVASSLNACHLDHVVAAVGKERVDRGPLGEMIRDSRVVRALRREGYRHVTFATGYWGTEIWTADERLSPRWALSEFDNLWLSMTPLPYFGVLTRGVQYASHRNRVRFTLDSLGTLDDVEGPKFVFAHVVAPHPPFVFDAKGNPLTPSRPFSFADGSHFMIQGDREEYRRGYVGQVAYLNTQLMAAIDRLLASPRGEPVIILQGDHGPGSELDWWSVEESNLRERTAILSALRLPGGAVDGLRDGMTPVNTFRVVLNELFGAGLEMLDNRSFYSAIDRPYDLIDVTELVGE